MGNQLSDSDKFVVAVFLVLLAGGVAGLFFLGNAILGMKDAIDDLQVSVAGIQRDIRDMREDIASMRAEVSERFDVIEGTSPAMEMTIETHHGSPPRPAN